MPQPRHLLLVVASLDRQAFETCPCEWMVGVCCVRGDSMTVHRCGLEGGRPVDPKRTFNGGLHSAGMSATENRPILGHNG